MLEIVKEFDKKLPKFPDGRIDYSNSNSAAVMTIFVKHKNEILLLKRSDTVLIYKGKWNAVAGYLDEIKPIREKILEELSEELGIDEKNIVSISTKGPEKIEDKLANKLWISILTLVELKNKPEIKLDWEHTDYRWIKPEEINNFDIVPRLDKNLETLLKK